MRINPEDLRRHYQSLPDGELLALNRDDLTEVGQQVYDEEIERRNLNDVPEEEFLDEEREPTDLELEEAELELEMEEETGEAPDWLPDAAVACSFVATPGSSYAVDASHARAGLRAAGIPCHLTMERVEREDGVRHEECHVMVPGALTLHATSVLDQAVFNPKQEADWRSHLEALSDDELRALKPEIFCAGMLDRVARMKRAFHEELSRRKA